MSSSTTCTSRAYQSQDEKHQHWTPAVVIRQQLRRWHQNWRTRRQLSALGAHELQDIGLSRSEALEEASKPFWRS